MANANGKPCVTRRPGKKAHIAVVAASGETFPNTVDVMSVHDRLVPTLTWEPHKFDLSPDNRVLRIRLHAQAMLKAKDEKGKEILPPDSGELVITLNAGSPAVNPVPVEYVDDPNG